MLRVLVFFLACSAVFGDGDAETFEESTSDLCPQGYYATPGASERKLTPCTKCSPGYYSNTRGSPECKKCPPGTTSDYASQECYPCSPGTYADVEGSPHCSQCQDGSEQPDYGGSSCNECKINHYSNENGGKFSCLPCEDGKDTRLQTGAIECLPCLYAGCSPCPKGFFYNDTECELCPDGFTTDAANDILDCTVPCETSSECYSFEDFNIGEINITKSAPPPLIEPVPLMTPLGWAILGLLIFAILIIIIASVAFCVSRANARRMEFDAIERAQTEEPGLSPDLRSTNTPQPTTKGKITEKIPYTVVKSYNAF